MAIRYVFLLWVSGAIAIGVHFYLDAESRIRYGGDTSPIWLLSSALYVPVTLLSWGAIGALRAALFERTVLAWSAARLVTAVVTILLPIGVLFTADKPAPFTAMASSVMMWAGALGVFGFFALASKPAPARKYNAARSMKCPGCDYELALTATLCPECGCSLATWDATTPEFWHRHRRTRIRLGAIVALVLLLFANVLTLISWARALSWGLAFSAGWPCGVWVSHERVSWGGYFSVIGLVVDLVAVPAFAAMGAGAGYLLHLMALQFWRNAGEAPKKSLQWHQGRGW